MVFGAAIVGKAVARYFHEQGYALNIMDKRILEPDEMSKLQQKNINFYSESEKTNNNNNNNNNNKTICACFINGIKSPNKI